MGLIKPIVDSLITIGAKDEPEDPEDDSVARPSDVSMPSLPPSLPKLSSQHSTLESKNASAVPIPPYPHIEQLWPFIDTGLEDSDPRVRRAACTALSCICEMLVDKCASRHQILVPRVSALLNDPACQRNAMTALDGLLEVLDDQTIGLYLHPLMERLVPMIDSAPPKLKGTVVGAIGSAAYYAAKGAFEPYFDVCMQRITPFLSLKGEGDEQELRGVARDTAIELNSPSLRECSMIFFGTLAKVYESEFVAYLPRVMPAVFASLGQFEEDDGSVLPSEMIKGFKAADDDKDEAEEDSPRLLMSKMLTWTMTT
ncbi:hypothetical protein PGT21_019966 [Puccinia graminis f. sp. tritici]|uniref:Uncharacterized protein n=1 Tax=Puccinia graminis f. sp. tritici TaxID=56615 RepID=A0A5B0MLY7_PUCGR|nr:hypothetical protein PGT21_019966 [Puccinia graminis f. sp. tritici]